MELAAGFDLSLTATGIAVTYDDEPPRAWTYKPTGTGITRMRAIVAEVAYWARDADMAVIEGPAFGAQGRGQHERAGLWWLVYNRLDRDGIAIAVAPPASVKKYACGRGNAPKGSVMLACAKRFPDFDGDDNAADALWLAAMGAEHLGHPIATMPQAHRDALKGVAWPQLPGDEE